LADTARTAAKKGGGVYDLGRFLSHLLRGWILIQPVVVSGRRSALAPASAALFAPACGASCGGRTRQRARRTRAGRPRQRGSTRNPWPNRTYFAVQLRPPDGVSGLVWRHRLPA